MKRPPRKPRRLLLMCEPLDDCRAAAEAGERLAALGTVHAYWADEGADAAYVVMTTAASEYRLKCLAPTFRVVLPKRRPPLTRSPVK